MGIDLNCTLDEAKQWLRKRLTKGARCPLCHQYAKLYKRKLNTGLAKFLLDLYKIGRHEEYHHIASLLHFKTKTSGTDFYILKFWELIEEKSKDINADTKTSGYWKITCKGIAFVEQRLKVPSHVCLYNGRLFGFEGEKVTIGQCLGERFSYSELMGGF